MAHVGPAHPGGHDDLLAVPVEPGRHDSGLAPPVDVGKPGRDGTGQQALGGGLGEQADVALGKEFLVCGRVHRRAPLVRSNDRSWLENSAPSNRVPHSGTASRLGFGTHSRTLTSKMRGMVDCTARPARSSRRPYSFVALVACWERRPSCERRTRTPEMARWDREAVARRSAAGCSDSWRSGSCAGFRRIDRHPSRAGFGSVGTRRRRVARTGRSLPPRLRNGRTAPRQRVAAWPRRPRRRYRRPCPRARDESEGSRPHAPEPPPTSTTSEPGRNSQRAARCSKTGVEAAIAPLNTDCRCGCAAACR